MFSQLVRLFFAAQRRLLLWTLCGCLIALAWAVLFGRDPLMDYLDNLEKRNALSEKVKSLEQEIGELEREKNLLDQGGFETEKTAREQLHLSRPGEDVLYLDYPEDEGAEASPDNVNDAPPPAAGAVEPILPR